MTMRVFLSLSLCVCDYVHVHIYMMVENGFEIAPKCQIRLDLDGDQSESNEIGSNSMDLYVPITIF